MKLETDERTHVIVDTWLSAALFITHGIIFATMVDDGNEDIGGSNPKEKDQTQSTTSFARSLKSREPARLGNCGWFRRATRSVSLYYHSAIMASYSEYVDTMLASPMKESSTMRITFPDIEPDVWRKMIMFLEPGGTRSDAIQFEEYGEFLPFYDEYGFRVGLDLLDSIFSDYFDLYKQMTASLMTMTIVAELSYRHDLPLSKKKAIEFARKQLGSTRSVRVNEIKALLPLIQEDEETLKDIVSLLVGSDQAVGMTLQEFRTATSEESFPACLATMYRQIYDQNEVVRHLVIENVDVISPQEIVPEDNIYGSYDKQMKTKSGAMQYVYTKIDATWDNVPVTATLEALDPFGKQWQISISQNDEATEEKRVIFAWKSHYSSVSPPKRGWKAVDDENGPVPTLSYYYGRYGY